MRFFGTILTLFIVSSPAVADRKPFHFVHVDDAVQAESSERKMQTLRLLEVLALLNEATSSATDRLSSQLANLIESRAFLREGGVIHIVGPGQNSIEWLWPLVLRPDVTVIVSEPDEEAEVWAPDPARLVRALRYHAPEWLLKSSTMQSEEDVRAALQRLRVQKSVEENSPARADVLILRNPRPFGLPNYSNQLKPGTIVWMTTFDQAFTPPEGSLYVEGALPALAMQNLKQGPNEFEEGGFVWVAPEAAKLPHPTYDHGITFNDLSSAKDPYRRQCEAWMRLFSKLNRVKAVKN